MNSKIFIVIVAHFISNLDTVKLEIVFLWNFLRISESVIANLKFVNLSATEAYSEACQTSKMQRFVKIVRAGFRR